MENAKGEKLRQTYRRIHYMKKKVNSTFLKSNFCIKQLTKLQPIIILKGHMMLF